MQRSEETNETLTEIQSRYDAIGEVQTTSEGAFWMALPDFFATVPQQCVLSADLWDEQGTHNLVINLRVYDILRRLYYVRSGQHATPAEVLKCMRMVMGNPDLREFIVSYARAGTFPDTSSWHLLKK